MKKMSLIDYLMGKSEPTSAAKAKERLQLVFAHERYCDTEPNFLPALKKDLLAVIANYVKIDQDNLQVSLDRTDQYEILELNLVLPDRSATEEP